MISHLGELRLGGLLFLHYCNLFGILNTELFFVKKLSRIMLVSTFFSATLDGVASSIWPFADFLGKFQHRFPLTVFVLMFHGQHPTTPSKLMWMDLFRAWMALVGLEVYFVIMRTWISSISKNILWQIQPSIQNYDYLRRYSYCWRFLLVLFNSFHYRIRFIECCVLDGWPLVKPCVGLGILLKNALLTR